MQMSSVACEIVTLKAGLRKIHDRKVWASAVATLAQLCQVLGLIQCVGCPCNENEFCKHYRRAVPACGPYPNWEYCVKLAYP